MPVSVMGRLKRRKAVEASEVRPSSAMRKVAGRKRASRYGIEARRGRERSRIWYCWLVAAFWSARDWMRSSCSEGGGSSS